MQYEERIKNCLKDLKIVGAGAIFHSHYSVSGFGNENKEWHYNVCFHTYNYSYNHISLNPCTSIESPNAFVFNLSKDSTVRVETDAERNCYCLFSVICRIEYKEFEGGEKVMYKGILKEKPLARFKKEKRQFIKKQFRHLVGQANHD